MKDNIETSAFVGAILLLDFYYLMPEGVSWSDIGCISEDEGPYAFCDFSNLGSIFQTLRLNCFTSVLVGLSELHP